MANQIRMTPDTMRTRAKEYTNQAKKVEDVIKKMDSLLKQLQSEWEGSASDAYAQKFNELRPGFVKAKELIDEIANSLNQTAKAVEETDKNIASQFRG